MLTNIRYDTIDDPISDSPDFAMRPPKNSWPNTPGGNGVLLFAQLMREMLSEQSFESFRAFSLATPARLSEAISLVEDVVADRIPRIALDPVLSELIWSIQSDDIARDLVGPDHDIIVGAIGNSQNSLESIFRNIKYLQRKISEKYKASLEEKIISLYNNDRRRGDFRDLVGFYCSNLVNVGYSKSYILRMVDDRFFNRDIGRIRVNTLSKFLLYLIKIIRNFLCILLLKRILQIIYKDSI